MISLRVFLFILSALISCAIASTNKYLVLGHGADPSEFLSAFTLYTEESSCSWKFFHNRSLLRLSINSKNIFGQDKAELLFLRDFKSIPYSTLVTMLRWAQYGPISGIILLEDDHVTDQDVFKPIFDSLAISPNHQRDSIMRFGRTSSEPLSAGESLSFVINGETISWNISSRCPSEIIEVISLAATSVEPIALASTANIKSLARLAANQALADAKMTRPSASLHRIFFDFFFAFLFPVDLVKRSLAAGHLDILGYLLRPLAPSYVQDITSAIPRIQHVLPLLYVEMSKADFAATMRLLGYMKPVIEHSLTALQAYRTAPATLDSHFLVFSLNSILDLEVPIFAPIIAGLLRGLEEEALVKPFATYLESLVLLENSQASKESAKIRTSTENAAKAQRSLRKLVDGLEVV